MSAHLDGARHLTGCAFEALEDALVKLHVNVLESRISAYKAASVNPKELERCRTSRGNGASGEVEEVSEETEKAELSCLAPGVSGEIAPGALCAEGK